MRRLIRGEVEDHNGHFAPTTAELARVVRYEDWRIEAEHNHAQRQIAKPVEPALPELTEDEMARRREQVQRLLSTLKVGDAA